nr:hypothetical protein [Planctomycetota bacterium]
TLDGVKYRLGSADSPEGGKRRKDVKSIEYADFQDVDHAKATGLLNKGEQDKAGDAFIAVTKSTIYAALRERSYLDAADAFIAAKQPDKALAALKELEAKAPRSVHLPRAVELAFAIEKGRGNRAAAQEAVDKLKKNAKDWGIEADVLAATGQASLHREDKKLAESAKELERIWGSVLTLSATSDEDEKEQYARVGEQLALDYGLGGQAEKAFAVYKKLMYESLGAPQARAHLAYAQAMSTSKDLDNLRTAFDHALIALVMPEGDTQVRTKAKSLARTILAAFDKAAEADPKLAGEVAEYRKYLNAL